MMKYIKDSDVYKAVNFAASMIKKGTRTGLAVYKAASYYNVSSSEVAHHLGSRGNNQKNIKKKNDEWQKSRE